MHPTTKRHSRATKPIAAVVLAAFSSTGAAFAAADSGPVARSPEVVACVRYRADYAYPIQLCGRGEAVRVAQLALSVVDAPPVADGYFGPLTQGAVRRFQHESGLPVTGEIDEPTWIALTDGTAHGHDADGDDIVDPWEVGGVAPTARPTCTRYRADYAYPIQLCGRGEAVRVAQLALSVVDAPPVADGYFGPLTQGAVRRFQHESGLPVTGEIDEPTWIALTNGTARGHDDDADGTVDPWEVS